MLKISDLGQLQTGHKCTYRDDSASREGPDGAGGLAESRSEHCIKSVGVRRGVENECAVALLKCDGWRRVGIRGDGICKRWPGADGHGPIRMRLAPKRLGVAQLALSVCSRRQWVCRLRRQRDPTGARSSRESE